MQPGDEWVYRLRDSAPSERVRILEVHQGKRGYRADVEFLDRTPPGEVENVPGARLRAPWAELEQYEAIERAWAAMVVEAITDVELNAINLVYATLLPREVAAREWQPVMGTTAVHDLSRLEELLGCSLEQAVAGAVVFKPDERTIVSPEGSLQLARRLTERDPEAILDMVVDEEREARRRCAGGPPRPSRRPLSRGESSYHVPEIQWEIYRSSDRPAHELLRAWCGHRAVTVHERLLAAEAEVQRLDDLLYTVIDLLNREDDDPVVEHYRGAHMNEMITPYNIRPLVERPLTRDEVATEVVYRRRRPW